MGRLGEEPCEVKVSSTVLKTSRLYKRQLEISLLSLIIVKDLYLMNKMFGLQKQNVGKLLSSDLEEAIADIMDVLNTLKLCDSLATKSGDWI